MVRLSFYVNGPIVVFFIVREWSKEWGRRWLIKQISRGEEMISDFTNVFTEPSLQDIMFQRQHASEVSYRSVLRAHQSVYSPPPTDRIVADIKQRRSSIHGGSS